MWARLYSLGDGKWLIEDEMYYSHRIVIVAVDLIIELLLRNEPLRDIPVVAKNEFCIKQLLHTFNSLVTSHPGAIIPNQPTMCVTVIILLYVVLICRP